MKWYECAGIGVIMGCLYGLVLWVSVLTRDAYYMALDEMYLRPNYGVANITPIKLEWNSPMVEVYNHTPLLTPDPNMVYMPFVVTGVVMLVAFAVLFSVPLWYPFAERWIQETGKQIADDLEEDDGDEE